MTNATQRAAAFRTLASWLAATHPQIFNAILGKAVSKGLGDWTDTIDVVDPGSLSSPSVDVGSTVDVSNAATDALNSAGGAPDNSSSSSSWLSSIGSDLGSGISAVGSYLATNTAPLLNAAGAFFKAQANQSAAQAQQSILQTQVARAQSGQPAAPITYVRNPVTGALQAAYVAPTNSLPPAYIASQPPLLQSASGVTAYPLSQAGLSQLAPSGVGTFLSQYGVWIGLGVMALLILPRMGSSND